MDLNYNYLLIPIVASLLSATASTTGLDSEFLKQRRLFNAWDSDASSQDEPTFDESTVKINPGIRFLEEFFRSQIRPQEYDVRVNDEYHYENEREIESSLPYGVQNEFDATGRPVRSKNRIKTTFQPLCRTERETVFLNLNPDIEYRPDYYEEVRCTNAIHSGTRTGLHIGHKVQPAVCNGMGFRCIQLNGTVFLTRRSRGDSCWETEIRSIAAGCECMWPMHQLGDITAHH